MALTDEQARYEEEYNKAFYGDEFEASQADDMPSEEAEADTDTGALDNAEEQAERDDTDSDTIDDTPSDDEHTDEQDTPDVDTPSPKRFKLKIDGKEVEMDFTDEEIVAGMQKSFDYTKKTQTLAEYRKTIDKLNSLGIDPNELDIFAKAKSGDREALAYLTKHSGVDPLELIDVEPTLTLQNDDDYIVPSQQVQEILHSVSQDYELNAKLKDAEKSIPKPVLKMAAQDPNALYAVINEVKSGDFERIQPQLQMAMMRMTDYERAYVQNSADAYINLYNSVKNGLTQPSVQQEEKPKPTPQPKPNMAEVGIKKSGATTTRQVLDDVDAFDSDEVYQKMLSQLNQFKK